MGCVFCQPNKPPKKYLISINPNIPELTLNHIVLQITNLPTAPNLSKLLSSKEDSHNKLSLSKEETTTSFSDIRKVYKIETKILGSGNFGTVYVASSISNLTQKYAVKTICKEKIKKNLQILQRELEILKTLDHPNIVKFHEVYQDEKFFHLVMEHCSGGDLFEKIEKERQINEQEAACIMKKIFSATNYLHERGICHRDLKPENFLFTSKIKGCEIKIIDYGLSKQFETNISDLEGSFRELKTIVGTPLYVAPEVLKGKYDFRCDNWSLGVVTFVLLCGSPPFFGRNTQEIFKKLKEGKISFAGSEWKNVSKQAKDFISNLICLDVNKRMGSKEALKHPWLKMNLNDEPNEGKKLIDPKIVNLIKNFRGANVLKKEVMRTIVNHLSENEITNLREAFRLIDSDHRGIISIEELKKVLQEFGFPHNEEDFKGIMQTFNEETGGEEINYTEFIAATLDKKIYLNNEKLFSAFKHFDIDNSGCITVANLKEVMARAGRNIMNEILQSWINENDKKRNGQINFEEFYEMMKDKEIQEKENDELDLNEKDKEGKKDNNEKLKKSNINDKKQKNYLAS